MIHTLSMNGQSHPFESTVTYAEAFKTLKPSVRHQVVAAKVGGEVFALCETIDRSGEVSALTVEDDLGRRVYERTLRFVFLLAVKEICPDARVVMAHSMGNGVFCHIRCHGPLTQELADDIKAKMRALIAEDLPIEKHSAPKAEMMAYYDQHHQPDKVRLLQYRQNTRFTYYQCKSLREYFYGVLAPSTGCIPVFELHFCLPGVLLQMPDRKDPSVPAANEPRAKYTRAVQEAEQWAINQGITTVSDLNQAIADGTFRDFVRVCEAAQEHKIASIAEQIVQKDIRLVLIAGPSSSGKTTTCNRLSVQLRAQGAKPVLISLDNYYLPKDQVPLDEDGKPDVETMYALDIALFNRQLAQLFQGQRVELPVYDFQRGGRSEKTIPLQIEPHQPVIVEGIHGLNEKLTESIPPEWKFKLFVCPLTQLRLDDHNRIRTTDSRLLRRMVRDVQFRDSPVERTMDMWKAVRRGEDLYINPYLEQADEVFNTMLLYELAILKKYAYSMLLQVPAGSPHYIQARQMVKFLNYIVDADAEDEIPPNSLLREFIGGSCFYREHH